MHELFNKQLSELGPDDIDALVHRGDSEDQYTEFKEQPPGKAGTWQKATSDLASEVVAFANADGGVLVLGIKEEGNQATGVEPIPDAEKVADSLHRSFASIIDPYPVGLEVAAVPYSKIGGVIVARVPASPEAPHGVKDKQRFRVTVRRGEEAKPLDMRDIQLHTLETRRRADDAEQRLEARRAAFRELPMHDGLGPAGYRITVTPARAVYRVAELMENSTRPLPNGLCWSVHAERRSPTDVQTVFHRALSGGWRPCLRGMIAAADVGRAGFVAFSTFEDGTVDVVRVPAASESVVSAWPLLGDYLGAIDLATILRETAGAGRAELMIDVEFATIGPTAPEMNPAAVDLHLSVSMPNDFMGTSCEVRTPLRFPRYTLVVREDLSRVAAEFWRDLCGVAGVADMPAITCVERVQR